MEGEGNYDFQVKIVMVGDSGVGKTCLLSQYIKHSLPHNPNPTIGVEFAVRITQFAPGKAIKAQVWDTAGKERYQPLVKSYYRGSAGAFILYDITNLESFNNAHQWIPILKSSAEPDIIIMLLGNKADLVDQSPELRQVGVEQAEEFARSQGIMFREVSALDLGKVNQAFEILIEDIYNKKNRIIREERAIHVKKSYSVEEQAEYWCNP